MEAQEKEVVAFLGPKASYTHQVSPSTRVSYSARLIQHTKLVKQRLRQVSL